MEHSEAEQRIVEQLRTLSKDKSLKYLPQEIIKCLDILIDRDKKYNMTLNCYDNTFSAGDAEAFINSQQNFKRIDSIVHNGNTHLECHIPKNKFEDNDILQDGTNWFLIWSCNRTARSMEGYEETGNST